MGNESIHQPQENTHHDENFEQFELKACFSRLLGLTPFIRLEVLPQLRCTRFFRVESCLARPGLHTDEECRSAGCGRFAVA
jgi:hypothetical protein